MFQNTVTKNKPTCKEEKKEKILTFACLINFLKESKANPCE
jgi:hypothetical protein